MFFLMYICVNIYSYMDIFSSQGRKIVCDLLNPTNCPLWIKGLRKPEGIWVTADTSVLDHGSNCLGCLHKNTVASLSNGQLATTAGKCNQNLKAPVLTELLRCANGGGMPSSRGMRRVTHNVTTNSSPVFDTPRQDYEAIHSACQLFMSENPGSFAQAHNDTTESFASFTVVFEANARRVRLSGHICVILQKLSAQCIHHLILSSMITCITLTHALSLSLPCALSLPLCLSCKRALSRAHVLSCSHTHSCTRTLSFSFASVLSCPPLMMY